jgi:hypothetical protein
MSRKAMQRGDVWRIGKAGGESSSGVRFGAGDVLDG